MKTLVHCGQQWLRRLQLKKKIDYKACARLIDYLIANGTDVLVVAGTTGESPQLSAAESSDLFRFCVQHANNRVPIIAGTGTNSTKTTIERTVAAEKTGVDGIMVVTPYYNKPSQQGMLAHFKAVAACTELPVMLYNVPGRTGINMEAPITIELAKVNNIVAIKEASGDLEQIATIIEHTDETFAVYSGDDALALPILALGGDGVVSVASHVIGAEMQAMIQAYQSGQRLEAAAAHRKLLPIMKAMFLAPNPICVKYALKQRGIDVGDVLLPLEPITAQEKTRVDLALNTLE